MGKGSPALIAAVCVGNVKRGKRIAANAQGRVPPVVRVQQTGTSNTQKGCGGHRQQPALRSGIRGHPGEEGRGA